MLWRDMLRTMYCTVGAAVKIGDLLFYARRNKFCAGQPSK